MQNNQILGVDIGGSGMKAALVDVEAGAMATDRFRIETPQPPTPDAMVGVFAQLVEHFAWQGPIGCTFPGVIRRRAVVDTAANLDPSWVGTDGAKLFGSVSTGPVALLNDADAAGLAEMRFGAGKGITGVVFMLTIGTGLGTAIFTNGELLPNTELGHIQIDGIDAEDRASNRAREADGLTVADWASTRLQNYLTHIEDLLSPDLFIIGGGISKQFDQFGPLLQTRAEIVPAALRNHAGIVGAAVFQA